MIYVYKTIAETAHNMPHFVAVVNFKRQSLAATKRNLLNFHNKPSRVSDGKGK